MPPSLGTDISEGLASLLQQTLGLGTDSYLSAWILGFGWSFCFGVFAKDTFQFPFDPPIALPILMLSYGAWSPLEPELWGSLCLGGAQTVHTLSGSQGHPAHSPTATGLWFFTSSGSYEHFHRASPCLCPSSSDPTSRVTRVIGLVLLPCVNSYQHFPTTSRVKPELRSM